MAKLNFPSNPSIGQEYVAGSVTYVWNGTSWDSKLVGEITTELSIVGTIVHPPTEEPPIVSNDGDFWLKQIGED